MSHHELLAIQEKNGNGMSVYIKPANSVVITPSLVEEIRCLQDSLADKYMAHSFDEFYFIVWYLEKHGHMSCKGLDFSYIFHCLKEHKEHDFERYINRIFNLVFLNYIGLGLPIVNCSIVTRPLSGFSKEFFFLNQICFLQNKNIKGIKKIKLCTEFPHLNFDKAIYEKNQYFYYRDIQAEKMKGLIEHLNYEIPDKDQVEAIKNHFDSLNTQTLERIYDIAARDLKILERMGSHDL